VIRRPSSAAVVLVVVVDELVVVGSGSVRSIGISATMMLENTSRKSIARMRRRAAIRAA
jgi:hypothetical protein